MSQADVYPLDAQFFIAWSPIIISLNTLRRNNITQKLLISLTFDVATDCFIDAIDAKHQLTESVIHTLRLPEKIGDKWKDLARKLGYIESVVNAIQTEENNIPKECCITVLVRWMEREAEGATVERLAQVLTEIELKNLSRLLKGRRPWKGIRQFIILVATPVGKMKWTYVLIGYQRRQDKPQKGLPVLIPRNEETKTRVADLKVRNSFDNVGNGIEVRDRRQWKKIVKWKRSTHHFT